jgi:hypothetical protein
VGAVANNGIVDQERIRASRVFLGYCTVFVAKGKRNCTLNGARGQNFEK